MNVTVAQITARGLLGRRRALLLAPMPVLLIVLALLARNTIDSTELGVNTILVGFGLAVLVPLTSLIVGTGVLSPEIDDGTLLHILAKPLPRSTILLTKVIVAAVAGVIAVSPAFLVAGCMVGGLRLGLAFAVAGGVATIVYCAVFATLSLLSRRPVLVGLAYIIVWEGLLCSLISGAGVLSIQQFSVTLARRISGFSEITSTVSLPVALIMCGVVLCGACLLGIDRLRSFNISGSTS